jgi:hypothetical protein
MNTNANSRKWSWPQLNERRTTLTAVFSLLLLLTAPAVVQAQFDYTTNKGTITITRYTGFGGDVIIPDTTNGWPITSIADAVFWGKTLTSVTIPAV